PSSDLPLIVLGRVFASDRQAPLDVLRLALRSGFVRGNALVLRKLGDFADLEIRNGGKAGRRQKSGARLGLGQQTLERRADRRLDLNGVISRKVLLDHHEALNGVVSLLVLSERVLNDGKARERFLQQRRPVEKPERGDPQFVSRLREPVCLNVAFCGAELLFVKVLSRERRKSE